MCVLWISNGWFLWTARGLKIYFLLEKIDTETLEMLKSAYKIDAIGKLKCLNVFPVLNVVIWWQTFLWSSFHTMDPWKWKKITKASWKSDNEPLKKLRSCLEWLGLICGSRAIYSSTTITPLLTQPCICANYVSGKFVCKHLRIYGFGYVCVHDNIVTWLFTNKFILLHILVINDNAVAGGSFEVTLRNSTKQQLPGNNENR